MTIKDIGEALFYTLLICGVMAAAPFIVLVVFKYLSLIEPLIARFWEFLNKESDND